MSVFVVTKIEKLRHEAAEIKHKLASLLLRFVQTSLAVFASGDERKRREVESEMCHIVLWLMNNTEIAAITMEIGISTVRTSLNMSKKKRVIYMQKE